MEKAFHSKVLNSLSYSKRHQKSYLHKASEDSSTPQAVQNDQEKLKILNKAQDVNKSIQTPNFDEDYGLASNGSLISDSSQRIPSPQIQKILKNYSNSPRTRVGVKGKVQVKTILTKNNLEGLRNIGESVTPSPYMRQNMVENKKNPSIQMLKLKNYKRSKPSFHDMFYSNVDETTVLSKQIEHYENIIKKQSKQITKLKLPEPRTETRSKSISPTYFKYKQGKLHYEDFWNLKESQFAEPKHLHEMEGFKNLWICNIESKIINPPAGLSKVKKVPSSIINRYRFFK